MAQLGLDPEQMQALSTQLKNDAATIESLTSRITSKLNGTWWKGKDAEHFRSEWSGTHASNLKKVATALQSASNVITTNKNQQIQASN